MKLIRLLLFIVTFIITYHVDAQNKSVFNLKISINERNRPISAVLNSIEKRANVIFSFNSKILNTNAKVSVTATNKRLGEILPSILPHDVGYKAVSNNIVLYKKKLVKERPRTKANPLSIQTKPLAADTVFVYKTDTVIVVKTKVDTVYKQIVKIERDIDTVIQKNNPTANKQIGIYYQHSFLTSEYQHWGTSDRDVADRKRIENSEKNPEGFRVGIIGSYRVSNIKLTYGAAWTHISENHYFINNVDSLGNELPTASKRKNVYNYLSIPMFAGWQFRISKNIDIEANAGCWFNIKLNAKGYFLDMSGDTSKVKSLGGAALSNATVDLSANIVLSYNVLSNMSVSISPSYQYQVISDFKRSYPVAKCRKGFGVAAMIGYTF